MTQRCRDDRGQVAGIEVIPFGLLIFVIGGLLLFNAWAAVDAKLAVVAAAREGARTAAEAVAGPDDAAFRAEHSVHSAMDAQGWGGPGRTETDIDLSGYARCGRVSVTVRHHVPAIAVPIVGGYGSGFTMSSTHSEIIDGYRGGLPIADSQC